LLELLLVPEASLSSSVSIRNSIRASIELNSSALMLLTGAAVIKAEAKQRQSNIFFESELEFISISKKVLEIFAQPVKDIS
jgi:hypothetical protein